MAPLSQRDRRAVLILGAAAAVALVFQFGLPSGSQPEAARFSSIDVLERRLRRLQEVARQRPRAAAELESATRDLTAAERGLLKAATPALASAQMQQIVKDLLKAQGINLQNAEFGAAKAAGEDYAQVPLTVAFTCGIDQWINLMTALRNAPQVLSTVTVQMSPSDGKNKLMQVHLTVAGCIPASMLAGAKGGAGP